MYFSEIRNLILDSKFSDLIFSTKPHVVAFARGGSAAVGLQDEGSDYDIIAYTLGFTSTAIPFVFINKKTNEKLSILNENLCVWEYDINNLGRGFYFLFLVANTADENIIVLPEYEQQFWQMLTLVRENESLVRAAFCKQYIEVYKKFLANDPDLNYHKLKYLYFWLYFFAKDNNLEIPLDLITKIKRLKVQTFSDFSEEEQQYFLKAGDYILETYDWEKSKFEQSFNYFIKEALKIEWE